MYCRRYCAWGFEKVYSDSQHLLCAAALSKVVMEPAVSCTNVSSMRMVDLPARCRTFKKPMYCNHHVHNHTKIKVLCPAIAFAITTWLLNSSATYTCVSW